MARPPGGAFDLKPKMAFLRPKRPPVIFEDHDYQHHEPLEVNVVDTSIGTGGGSCGEGADKSSPSTSGGGGAGGGCGTTATASPRSLAATTASAITTPSPSPGYLEDPEAIIISDKNDDEGDGSDERPSPTSTSTSAAAGSPTTSNDNDDDEGPRVKSYYEGIQNDNGGDVVLRRQPSGYRKVILQRNSYSTNEAGRLLKLCLEKHFNNQSETPETTEMMTRQNDTSTLDSYLEEVFQQLDYHRCGTISREDFETLCEVLDLQLSRPPSASNVNG